MFPLIYKTLNYLPSYLVGCTGHIPHILGPFLTFLPLRIFLIFKDICPMLPRQQSLPQSPNKMNFLLQLLPGAYVFPLLHTWQEHHPKGPQDVYRDHIEFFELQFQVRSVYSRLRVPDPSYLIKIKF